MRRVAVVVFALSAMAFCQDGAPAGCEAADGRKQDVVLVHSDGAWNLTSQEDYMACHSECRSASAWHLPNGNTLVEIGYPSDTDDWGKTVQYCFDRRGNLQSARLRFNRIDGFTLIRDYDSKLKMVGENLRPIHGQPQETARSIWAEYEPAHGRIEPYRKLEQLPFAGFVTREKKQEDAAPKHN